MCPSSSRKRSVNDNNHDDYNQSLSNSVGTKYYEISPPNTPTGGTTTPDLSPIATAANATPTNRVTGDANNGPFYAGMDVKGGDGKEGGGNIAGHHSRSNSGSAIGSGSSSGENICGAGSVISSNESTSSSSRSVSNNSEGVAVQVARSWRTREDENLVRSEARFLRLTRRNVGGSKLNSGSDCNRELWSAKRAYPRYAWTRRYPKFQRRNPSMSDAMSAAACHGSRALFVPTPVT